jgi:hypothetical protein
MSLAMINRLKKDRSIKDPKQHHVMLVCCAVFHNPEFGCFPTIEQLMEETRYVRSTIFKALEGLQKLGVLSKEYGGGGRGLPNRLLLFEEIQQKKHAQQSSDNGSHPNSAFKVHKQKKAKVRKSRPVIPEILRTPAFIAAWTNWLEYRQERRKPLSPRSEEMALKQCAELGEQRSIAAIEHSISSGYQGLFEPRQGSPSAHPPRNPNDFCS